MLTDNKKGLYVSLSTLGTCGFDREITPGVHVFFTDVTLDVLLDAIARLVHSDRGTAFVIEIGSETQWILLRNQWRALTTTVKWPIDY